MQNIIRKVKGLVYEGDIGSFSLMTEDNEKIYFVYPNDVTLTKNPLILEIKNNSYLVKGTHLKYMKENS